MKELDYEEMVDKAIQLISKQKTIVLATSDQGKVTARTVYCTSNGLCIYFLTSSAYMKCKQIKNNPSVAMCFSNIQIQGTASILGHPSLEDNKARLEKCVHLDEAFMSWAKYKNSVLIEVSINEIESWNNRGREYIDVVNKRSYRIG